VIVLRTNDTIRCPGSKPPASVMIFEYALRSDLRKMDLQWGDAHRNRFQQAHGYILVS
jgi:hypothetical protein